MNENLEKGISFFKKKNYVAAINSLSSAGDSLSFEENLDLAYYLGLSYSRIERYEEALLFLEQVVTASNDVERVNQCRLLLSVIYTKTNRVRLAEYELQKLLDIGYNPEKVYCAKAYSAWMQKNINESVSLYEKVLEMNKDNPTALNGLGYVLATENRELARAMSLVKDALKYSPNSPAYLDSLGWIYFKMGLVDDAYTAIKRAKDILHDNEDINFHFSEIMKAMARNREEDKLSKKKELR